MPIYGKARHRKENHPYCYNYFPKKGLVYGRIEQNALVTSVPSFIWERGKFRDVCESRTCDSADVHLSRTYSCKHPFCSCKVFFRRNLGRVPFRGLLARKRRMVFWGLAGLAVTNGSLTEASKNEKINRAATLNGQRSRAKMNGFSGFLLLFFKARN